LERLELEPATFGAHPAGREKCCPAIKTTVANQSVTLLSQAPISRQVFSHYDPFSTPR